MKKYLPFLLLGIATIIRLDMVVPLLAMFGYYMLTDPDVRWLKYLAITIAIFIIPQFVFRYLYFGQLLPNSYYFKMTGYPLLFRMSRGLVVMLKMFWYMNPLLFIIVLLKRKSHYEFLLLLLFLCQVFYSIYVGGDVWESFGGANRYILIAMPCFFILFSGSLYEIIRRLR